MKQTFKLQTHKSILYSYCFGRKNVKKSWKIRNKIFDFFLKKNLKKLKENAENFEN